ncbi:Sperm flagellar protein 2 [Rhizophlyctis rosea]|nr:Sperm flagellar protein 2 [Rhizophlyctis rosea]
MSHILAQWLNNEVKLSQPIPPPSLDTSFASGYLLGELLHRYDLQDDFTSSFSNAATPEAAIRNYTLVEKTLADKLGIRLSSNFVRDLIVGKSGCAAQLLYQVKTVLEGRGGVGGGKGVDVIVLGKETAGTAKRKMKREDPRLISYPSSPTGDQPRKLPHHMMEISPMQKFHDKEHQFFATNLKAKIKRSDHVGPIPPELPKDVSKKSIQKSDHRPLRRPKITARAAESPERQEEKEVPVGEMSLSDEEWEGEESLYHHVKRHAGLIKELIPATQYEAQLRLREQERREKQRKKMEQKRLHAVDFVRTELSDFEHRLEIQYPSLISHAESSDVLGPPTQKPPSPTRERGVTPTTPSSDPKEIKRFLSLKAPMDTVNHVKMLSSFLPSVEVQQKQGREYLEKIRLRKLEEEASRKEREQRRRKILLGQQHAQEELEKAHLEEAMIAKLMRQSKQERRIAEQLMQTRHTKNLLHENRTTREKQYADRRQKDYEEALARELALAESARSEYFRACELQLLQHREILQEKKEVRMRRTYAYCEGIVRGIVELGVKVAEYRGLSGGRDVSPRMLREWKLLFGAGMSVERGYDVVGEGDRVGGVREVVGGEGVGTEGGDEVVEGIELLDKRELEDYLEGKGFWKYPGAEGSHPTKNDPLGLLINTILEMTQPPQPTRKLPQLPNVPLRLALIGKRFAGKMTVATQLKERYGLHLVVVDELVKEAIKQADPSHHPHHPDSSSTPTSTHKPHKRGTAHPLTKSQIGARIQAMILAGHPVDDALFVALVVDAIKQVPEEKEGRGGWVLVDFPRNRNQAVGLERELSGYEDPKPIKLGNLKRSTPKDAPPPTTSSRSSADTTQKDRPPSKPSTATPQQQKDTSPTSKKPHTPDDDPRRRSLIAPLPHTTTEPTTPTPQSGIDAVILLDVSNEVAIKRARGRRVDTISGQKYHLEYHPPPVGEPGVYERLAEGGEEGMLSFLLSGWEEGEEGVREWFVGSPVWVLVPSAVLHFSLPRFFTDPRPSFPPNPSPSPPKQTINANTTPDATVESVDNVIEKIVQKKSEEKERTERERKMMAEEAEKKATMGEKIREEAHPTTHHHQPSLPTPTPDTTKPTDQAQAPPPLPTAAKKLAEEDKKKPGSPKPRTPSAQKKDASRTGSAAVGAGGGGPGRGGSR